MKQLIADHALATSLIFLLRSGGAVIGIAGSQAILQSSLLRQLNLNLNGPDSAETIHRIRESIAYLHQLDPNTQATVVGCYTMAFRATFTFISIAGGLTLVCTLLGTERAERPRENQIAA